MFRIYSNLMRPVKASTIIDVTSAEIGTKELRTASIFTNYFIKTFIFINSIFIYNGLIVFHKDIAFLEEGYKYYKDSGERQALDFKLKTNIPKKIYAEKEIPRKKRIFR